MCFRLSECLSAKKKLLNGCKYQETLFYFWIFLDLIRPKWIKLKKGAVWIALVGLFVYVDIKYRDFSTLEGTFITATFRVGVMKVPSVSLILPYFMVKIRFCHFLQGFMYAGS